MKKFFAILLAVTMLASMATVASAAESTTTLTTEVPAATYTLNIPANQEIAFGSGVAKIGNVTVTNASGFAYGKDLKVTVNYDAFTCDETTTTIPFKVRLSTNENFSPNYIEIPSGDSFVFAGKSDGTVDKEVLFKSWQGPTSTQYAYIDNVEIVVYSENWGKALAGEYTATITYAAEVVVEE